MRCRVRGLWEVIYVDPIEALFNIDFSILFVQVFVVLLGIKTIITVVEWFLKKTGLETKGMRKRREDRELLAKTSKNIDSLSENLTLLTQKHEKDIQTIYENNLKYREQSQEIRDDLKSNIENISQKIDDMTERNNKRIRAELKDRIGQSYRYYHQVRKINDMELNALEDLIESYELANGDNSFVHSVVQKEMYTWEKVDRV